MPLHSYAFILLEATLISFHFQQHESEEDNHAPISPLSFPTHNNRCANINFGLENSEAYEENKQSSLSSLQGTTSSSLVRCNITSNPMGEKPHKGSSQTVTFCFSDDQKNYHELEPGMVELGKDIRSCHSSPCFAAYDDPMMLGATEIGVKQGVKRQSRRGSSPEDNRNKTLSSSHIRKELR